MGIIDSIKKTRLGKFVFKNPVEAAALYFGAIYLFLPHDIHIQGYAVDWLIGIDFPHETHIIIGIGLLLIGLFLINKKGGFKKTYY